MALIFKKPNMKKLYMKMIKEGIMEGMAFEDMMNFKYNKNFF